MLFCCTVNGATAGDIPGGPCGPLGPCGPWSPCGPAGHLQLPV